MEKEIYEHCNCPECVSARNETPVSKSASVPCYTAAGARTHEEAGWCNYKGKCKSKHRVYEKGPCGGTRKTNSFMCQEAL